MSSKKDEEKDNNQADLDSVRREYTDAFDLFKKEDADHITVDDLSDVFKRLRIDFTPDEMKKMINTIDQNSDGKIDKAEFMSLMDSQANSARDEKQTYKEELTEAFNVFDMNGDGKISVKELHLTLQALGVNITEEDIKFMMSAVDENSDMEIDLEEFEKMMRVGPKELVEGKGKDDDKAKA